MLGETLSHYRILDRLGEGGMGVIYRALDTRLERTVALKLLRPETLADPDRKRRFSREARTASALNHPNIVTIYDIDTDRGVDFIAMEYLEGEPLDRLLAGQRLPFQQVLHYARAIAEALAAAHAAGIVHRDVKPANVMVTRTGQIKVLDFGLAKLTQPAFVDSEGSTRSASLQTKEGVVLGTVAYMSPEQAEGKEVDARSDIFSFGVVLYELLCGQRPFQASSVATLLTAILRDAPPRPKSLRPDASPDLERVVLRCLEKVPENRYTSAGELCEELRRCEERLAAAPMSLGAILRRPAVAVALALLVAVATAAAWLWFSGSRARWARLEALPEIDRLTEAGDIYGAYRLAREAERYIPQDARLREMLNRVTIPVSIVTESAGAEVFYKGYSTPDAPWEPLGQTPLEGVRIPYALMRWKISKEGFETYEGAPMGGGPFQALASGFALDRVGARPPGMVRVPGGAVAPPGLPPAQLGDYWLDRYEVTNEQFKAFVDSGGYQKRNYWTQPFLDEGRELSWEEAQALLRDATGRPGPDSWKLGAYAEGQGELPVGGVGWYEAAAYCQYAGKSLPTIYHWYGATAQDQLSDILRFSNFGDQGPSPVGSHAGLGDYGTYDMAGNVKEWCWNESGGRRYILGGAWGEPTYMFKDPDARRPFDRSASHGFRCAKFRDPPDEALLGPATPPSHDVRLDEPVPDDIFQAYRRMYAYDRTELDARVEAVDDGSPHWNKEKVSFRAAYGNERVTALLFLPRNAAPPYQAVIWFPGDDAFFFPSSESLASAHLFDFIPRSGRALVYPIYKGMYERHVPFSRAPNEWRDMMIHWSKDLGRTVDYLETREDIDSERLAYYGFSSGAVYGPIFTAIDPRFKASVLLGAGLEGMGLPPEMQVQNYAPRSRVPTLMVSGRDDFIFPVESFQRPFLRLLGAPEADKRHALLDGGHIPYDRLAIIREVLDWLDRCLGPVGAR